jgi:hypothetical protein
MLFSVGSVDTAAVVWLPARGQPCALKQFKWPVIRDILQSYQPRKRNMYRERAWFVVATALIVAIQVLRYRTPWSLSISHRCLVENCRFLLQSSATRCVQSWFHSPNNLLFFKEESWATKLFVRGPQNPWIFSYSYSLSFTYSNGLQGLRNLYLRFVNIVLAKWRTFCYFRYGSTQD